MIKGRHKINLSSMIIASIPKTFFDDWIFKTKKFTSQNKLNFRNLVHVLDVHPKIQSLPIQMFKLIALWTILVNKSVSLHVPMQVEKFSVEARLKWLANAQGLMVLRLVVGICSNRKLLQDPDDFLGESWFAKWTVSLILCFISFHPFCRIVRCNDGASDL